MPSLTVSQPAISFPESSAISQGRVRHCVSPVQQQLDLLHVENIKHLVLENFTANIILGRHWLILQWATGEALKWGEKRSSLCFPELPISACQSVKHLPVQSTSIESPLEEQSVDIPADFAPFSDIFHPR